MNSSANNNQSHQRYIDTITERTSTITTTVTWPQMQTPCWSMESDLCAANTKYIHCIMPMNLLIYASTLPSWCSPTRHMEQEWKRSRTAWHISWHEGCYVWTIQRYSPNSTVKWSQLCILGLGYIYSSWAAFFDCFPFPWVLGLFHVGVHGVFLPSPPEMHISKCAIWEVFQSGIRNSEEAVVNSSTIIDLLWAKSWELLFFYFSLIFFIAVSVRSQQCVELLNGVK